jgi:hypothetical protein
MLLLLKSCAKKPNQLLGPQQRLIAAIHAQGFQPGLWKKS